MNTFKKINSNVQLSVTLALSLIPAERTRDITNSRSIIVSVVKPRLKIKKGAESGNVNYIAIYIVVPDGSIARGMLFIWLNNGWSIFGRPRLARHYRLFCVGLHCRGVVTGAPVPRVSALCDPGHRKHTLNKQLENTVGRTGRILYGQYRNNRRNTTCIPAPWTDSPRQTDDYPSRSTTMYEIYSTRRDEACISSLSSIILLEG